MTLPAPLRTAVLVAVLGLLVGCFLGACSTIRAIAACEYVARPLTDSTAVVAYKTLPCWDANYQRVVRVR